jgi:hypothetical protein
MRGHRRTRRCTGRSANVTRTPVCYQLCGGWSLCCRSLIACPKLPTPEGSPVRRDSQKGRLPSSHKACRRPRGRFARPCQRRAAPARYLGSGTQQADQELRPRVEQRLALLDQRTPRRPLEPEVRTRQFSAWPTLRACARFESVWLSDRNAHRVQTLMWLHAGSSVAAQSSSSDAVTD